MKPCHRTPGLRRGLALVGGQWLAAHARRVLGEPSAAVREQESTRASLVSRLAGTAYGRFHGLEQGLSAGAFRTRMPVTDYETLEPWIERMKAGEAGVLWPGVCRHFAVSSGTTAGRTKYLPVTSAMLDHFRHTGLISLGLYANRAGHARVFQGRHLFLGGSTTLVRLPTPAGPGAWCGDLSGITALNLPAWVEHLLYEPGKEIAQLAEWPAKLEAIVDRTVSRDITLVAGIPSWLLVLAEVLRRRTGGAPAPVCWPNLECLIHGGVPVGPFAAELWEAYGPQVRFHEVFPASEAFIAAQEAEPEAGLRLLTGAGVYYEFLPLRAFAPGRLAELGGQALPLDAVQPGVDYVLLLTTPAGLCRYVIGDVVRFISTRPPRLLYVGRTRLQLSAFGEHVIEKELTDTLSEVGARHRLAVANFHVAPLFVDAAAGANRGRHEWWLEFRPASSPGTEADLAGELDRALQQRNDDYEAKRRGGGLDAPRVRVVPPGTFEGWLRQHGKWGGQHKMPRCRSDRAIADELAALVAPLCDGPVNSRDEATMG
ncbi:MAG: GH3 auxin-responsive promoter family protein [Verrucomicrobia bacterium]|nr:GH3 auxin-responsive promoter family protein [Verrucomicrobiota bacterium]